MADSRLERGKHVNLDMFCCCISAAVNSKCLFFTRWGCGWERELSSPQNYCTWRSKDIWSHPWVWGLLVSNDDFSVERQTPSCLDKPEMAWQIYQLVFFFKQFNRRKTKVFFLMGTASWKNSLCVWRPFVPVLSPQLSHNLITALSNCEQTSCC